MEFEFMSIFLFREESSTRKQPSLMMIRCIVGSPNLDHLSLLINHELLLIARDRRLGEALREQYFKDLADSSEVQAVEWVKRGWAERCLEALGWTARKIL
jgi:cardiolipin synthase A/B